MTRPWAFAAGTLALAVVWLGPLPSLARHSFSAHMGMHMGVVALAAPLVALGLAGGRWDPARRVPGLFAPMAACVLELVVVWGWHAPGLHRTARAGGPALALEQGSFLAVGLLLWLSAFGGAAEARRARAAPGVFGLLLTSMHMTLLGALLGLSTRPLYGHPLHQGFGLGPLADQHLGGAIMLLWGGAAYLAGGLALMVPLVRAGAAGAAGSPVRPGAP